MGIIFGHSHIYIGKDACEACGGRGARAFSNHTWHRCSRCDGKGHILVQEVGGSQDYAMQMTCPTCLGSGGTGSGGMRYGRCPDCEGTGRRKAATPPDGGTGEG